jgi:hypothetical protein
MELANSIVTLQPGMYILRHPKTGLPPISISRAAGKKEHNGTIHALYTPGTDGSVLRDGGDCIVMQVLNAPVDLLVTAYLEKAGAAVPALKVDKIKLEEDALMSARASQITIPPSGITLIGHVERVGDVVAADGQTLGKPESNLRLEGFQVMWPDKPEGVQLTYSARIEGAGTTPTVGVGQFCGTRSAAKRLVGLTFTLSGAKASEYDLNGKAYFSGGFETSIGSGADVRGPTGLEHLEAIQIELKPTAQKRGKGAWEPSSRTKVFKKASSKPSR